MQIIKKLLIGSVLIGGFVVYTQYEKSAEPTWKVNAEQFSVVKSLKDGMKREYNKFAELELMDKYGFLKNVNKTFTLKDSYRTLKIEKLWNMNGRMYVLYSVDVKERDKDEYNIPRLSVKNIQFQTKEGEELVLKAGEEMAHPGTRDEGFVYKHRLYRSMMLMPSMFDSSENDWSIVSNATVVRLQDLTISSKDKGVDSIQDIALTMPAEDPYTKVLKSKPIDQTITYEDNKKVKIKSIDALLYEQRLRVEIPNDEDLIGFASKNITLHDRPTRTYGILGTKKNGYYIPIYDMPDEMEGKKKEKILTFTSSVHKDPRSFSWTIPKKDIHTFLTNKNQPVLKNQEIVRMNDTVISYEGITLFEESPRIKLSLTTDTDQQLNHLRLIPDHYYNDTEVTDDYKRVYKNNIISISDEKKTRIKNFELHHSEEENKSTYHITFYNKEEIENGEMRPILIPESDLTITLSNLSYLMPLKNPVDIPFKNIMILN
ncbi:hypothetical protein ABE65_009415 [Fictibacillus phosphorivorans]|uniref:Uncharacterized protein n=1 Tax=Fictibacillus phosphorivorans TaxID=1221500 RepID=A0A161IIX7_9BACL|nr:hypothetical protein [Fictibacillus phosphorivorans]ANC77009.1 hypothetical protein ABE65_009415 [Fictibacillus phosphorivorans]